MYPTNSRCYRKKPPRLNTGIVFEAFTNKRHRIRRRFPLIYSLFVSLYEDANVLAYPPINRIKRLGVPGIVCAEIIIKATINYGAVRVQVSVLCTPFTVNSARVIAL